MPDEVEVIASQVVIPSETITPPVAEAPLPGTTVEVPRPEEVRAAEVVFAQEQEEKQLVAGMLGMWTGTLLMHDLMVDHFTRPADEERDRRKAKGKEKDEEGPWSA
jgi:hypothetical protein